MPAGSSPIIKTPPSAAPGLPSPEGRDLAGLSRVDEVEGYYNIDKQKAPSGSTFLVLDEVDTVGGDFSPSVGVCNAKVTFELASL